MDVCGPRGIHLSIGEVQQGNARRAPAIGVLAGDGKLDLKALARAVLASFRVCGVASPCAA
eukprot:7771633-Pyramimonas_sp.AAC.1